MPSTNRLVSKQLKESAGANAVDSVNSVRAAPAGFSTADMEHLDSVCVSL